MCESLKNPINKNVRFCAAIIYRTFFFLYFIYYIIYNIKKIQ